MEFFFEAKLEVDGGGWYATCTHISLGGIITNTLKKEDLEGMVKDAIKTALYASGVSGPYRFYISFV